MSSKMLIDASHPEETRVVVVSTNRIEEFDFESAARKQLRGNIYLAKVKRVEPALQAAFVDYGGNRHGFLAFSEIHPDYYQIPVADRQALLREQEEEDRQESARNGNGYNGGNGDHGDNGDNGADDAEAEETAAGEAGNGDAETDADTDSDGEAATPPEQVETVGGEDPTEELPRRARFNMRRYKIQEVIKRGQILLVQVVKEERGTKGAALTTYLSLAGRYCVLMPNTARGGGISRKITSAADRKRLKSVENDLNVPAGMGLIIRTAGANRTKAEIKRDFDYLIRLWENVRELTLRSTAPTLVYEEGSLIKRSIRDLYNKDIDTVLVEGDEAYKEAKAFMRMLMPSHAKNVQPYKDRIPLFQRFQVEPQLDAMFSPAVTLPSGGYVVINPTEALVSIDVNSGRSTREHNIEDTALKTNLEAAEEIARQLRLRDLAGLIVIDFIDMEENRNNRAVERKLKDCLKADRARIQVGRISMFGLLEMSRQRLRTGVLEGSMRPCPLCEGTGQVRSVESSALKILRACEEEGMRRRTATLIVRAPGEVAIYILNYKRDVLKQMEERYGLLVHFDLLTDPHATDFELERGEPLSAESARATRDLDVISVDDGFAIPPVEEAEGDEVDAAEDSEEGSAEMAVADEAAGDEAETGEATVAPERPARRERPRRGSRAARGREPEGDRPRREAETDTESVEEEDGEESSASAQNDDRPRKRRRRGKRGGRRNRRTPQPGGETTEEAAAGAGAHQAPDGGVTPEETGGGGRTATEPPAGNGSHGASTGSADEDDDGDAAAPPPPVGTGDEEAPAKRGWWQRRILGGW